MSIRDLLDWFTGGRPGYMTLVHCMNHDTFWITVTVALDLAVAAGYVVIAHHWLTNERGLRNSPAKSALATMKNIFVFCGICGYLFIPIKMFWPAWRLYDAFLAVLVYYTWRYALGSRELQVVYNQLENSEKLARDLEVSREEARRKSYFLNAISHDLKTPLNGLLLQAELAELEATAGDAGSLRASIEEIKRCARASADLLNHYLELGRLDWSQEPPRVTEFSLNALVGEVAERARPRAAEKGIGVAPELPEGLTVRADRVRVERILCNLVDNAIKFSDEGGVRLLAELSTAGVSIHVEDTGEGIALEHQRRIFEDFVQVNNRERDSRKGFGLGLAVSRRLAHQLGGHLTVESEPGRGSRFTLVLPEVPPLARSSPPFEGDRPEGSPARRRDEPPAAPPR